MSVVDTVGSEVRELVRRRGLDPVGRPGRGNTKYAGLQWAT